MWVGVFIPGVSDWRCTHSIISEPWGVKPQTTHTCWNTNTHILITTKPAWRTGSQSGWRVWGRILGTWKFGNKWKLGRWRGKGIVICFLVWRQVWGDSWLLAEAWGKGFWGGIECSKYVLKAGEGLGAISKTDRQTLYWSRRKYTFLFVYWSRQGRSVLALGVWGKNRGSGKL